MEVNSTYEPYSQEPEYIETNRLMLEALPLEEIRRGLDLACGTGLLSDLLVQISPGVALIGVDLSTESLDIARRLFADKGLLVDSREAWEFAAGEGRSAVRLLEGSVERLDFPDQSFDLVMMGNAIHLMPDQPAFVREVWRVLRVGGIFCFNSVFFSGTFPESSEYVYSEWMKEAVRVLQEKNQARRAEDLPPIGRKRGKAGRAFDKGWRSADQWSDLLQAAGFEISHNQKRMVPISQRGLELVGAYSGLAEVLMSGYPVEVASECLQQAVGRAFHNAGVSEVGRYWLEIAAVRR